MASNLIDFKYSERTLNYWTKSNSRTRTWTSTKGWRIGRWRFRSQQIRI